MVATAERVGKVARIGGWVWVIRAMPELKRFFCFDVFPKEHLSDLKKAGLKGSGSDLYAGTEQAGM